MIDMHEWRQVIKLPTNPEVVAVTRKNLLQRRDFLQMIQSINNATKRFQTETQVNDFQKCLSFPRTARRSDTRVSAHCRHEDVCFRNDV